jgi:Fe-Mn family superoxide dismutase
MFTLPPLPYAYDALSPVISDRTLRFHHDKHHAAYVKTLNELLGKKGGGARSLEEVIAEAANSSEAKLLTMRPRPGTTPSSGNPCRPNGPRPRATSPA